MYKQDLALNEQQRLICHKTKPNQSSVWSSNKHHQPSNLDKIESKKIAIGRLKDVLYQHKEE